MTDWNPGTGAYGLITKSSHIGHYHEYGKCEGGDENFIFGYNYDFHQRGSHCSYPTSPGKIDWYNSGMFRECQQENAGFFECRSVDAVPEFGFLGGAIAFIGIIGYALYFRKG